MDRDLTLPEDYSPFEELVICGNVFQGVIPINVGGKYPFLVGRGVLPIVWISVPIAENEWIYIVERNTSLNQIVTVELSKEKNLVKVFVEDERIIKQNIIGEWKIPLSKTIIEVTKETESKAIITELDLRSTGFNIYGNKEILYFGASEISNNNISGHVMINIGG